MGQHDTSYTETDEAREAREAHNSKAGVLGNLSFIRSELGGSSSENADMVELPCPAGSVLVDLSEVLDQSKADTASHGVLAASGPGSRRQ